MLDYFSNFLRFRLQTNPGRARKREDASGINLIRLVTVVTVTLLGTVTSWPPRNTPENKPFLRANLLRFDPL